MMRLESRTPVYGSIRMGRHAAVHQRHYDHWPCDPGPRSSLTYIPRHVIPAQLHASCHWSDAGPAVLVSP